MELKEKFKLKDEFGKETTYDVLFTFDNEETNKSYVVYTDNSLDDEILNQIDEKIQSLESDNRVQGKRLIR